MTTNTPVDAMEVARDVVRSLLQHAISSAYDSVSVRLIAAALTTAADSGFRDGQKDAANVLGADRAWLTERLGALTTPRGTDTEDNHG